MTANAPDSARKRQVALLGQRLASGCASSTMSIAISTARQGDHRQRVATAGRMGVRESTARRRHRDLEITDRQDLQNPSRQPDLLPRLEHHHRRAATTIGAGGAGRQPQRHDASTTTHPRRRADPAHPRRTRTQRHPRRRAEPTTIVLGAKAKFTRREGRT